MCLEMECLELELVVRWDFSTQWLSLPYWGWGLILSVSRRSPEDQAWVGTVPFKCVFSPLPVPGNPCPRRGSAEISGAHVDSLLSLAENGGLSYLQCPACADAHIYYSCSTQMHPWLQVLFVTAHSLLWPCPVVEPHHRAGRAHMDS